MMTEEDIQQLPEEIRAKIRTENGEPVYVLLHAGKEYRFPVDSEFILQLESALRIMRENHDALQRLARS